MIKSLSFVSALVLGLSTAGQSWAQSETPPENPAATPADITAEAATPEAPLVLYWTVCNETSFSLKIAYGQTQGKNPAARGWESLRSGGCLETDIADGQRKYLYAKSSKAHRGGIREWKGNVPLCTREDDFQAQPDIGCALQDMSKRLYMPVAADEPVTTLVEIENFGRKASTAGIQRLLKDNGYEISRVDGIAGRRTSQTLSKFLKDNELSSSLSVGEQMEALEAASLEKMETVGLTLCNRSTAGLWAAIGLRRKGNWESRGWWKIGSESCTQVYTETLTTADLSFFASQEGGLDEAGGKLPDRAMRSLAATPSQFCISDAKFSVLGRENCADFGYGAANFRIAPTDKEGQTIDLTDADFAEPNTSGLRQ